MQDTKVAMTHDNYSIVRTVFTVFTVFAVFTVAVERLSSQLLK